MLIEECTPGKTVKAVCFYKSDKYKLPVEAYCIGIIQYVMNPGAVVCNMVAPDLTTFTKAYPPENLIAYEQT